MGFWPEKLSENPPGPRCPGERRGDWAGRRDTHGGMNLQKGVRVGGWRDALRDLRGVGTMLGLCVRLGTALRKHWTQAVSSAAGERVQPRAGVLWQCLASPRLPAEPHQPWVGVGCGGHTASQGQTSSFAEVSELRECQAWAQSLPGRGTVGRSLHDMVWERQSLPPHPPLQMQKPEGWAGLGLAGSWLQPVWTALPSGGPSPC